MKGAPGREQETEKKAEKGNEKKQKRKCKHSYGGTV